MKRIQLIRLLAAALLLLALLATAACNQGDKPDETTASPTPFRPLAVPKPPPSLRPSPRPRPRLPPSLR